MYSFEWAHRFYCHFTAATYAIARTILAIKSSNKVTWNGCIYQWISSLAYLEGEGEGCDSTSIRTMASMNSIDATCLLFDSMTFGIYEIHRCQIAIFPRKHFGIEKIRMPYRARISIHTYQALWCSECMSKIDKFHQYLFEINCNDLDAFMIRHRVKSSIFS